MAGHGGGAWKVAYADFVTAMMAFFLVMWILAQSKPVKQAVAQYFKDPYGTSSKPTGPLSLLPAGKSLESPAPRTALKGTRGPGRGPGSDSRKPPATEGKKRGRLEPTAFVLHDGENRMEGTVAMFVEDSADLKEQGTRELKRVAAIFRGKPNKIEIRGHTSQRPTPPGSPFADSWQLCFARCQTALKLLIAEGVEPERVRLSQAGPFEPYTIREEYDSQAENSRVEVYMLGEIAEDFVGTAEERAKRVAKP
jgi:chemotaxis protein MotB